MKLINLLRSCYSASHDQLLASGGSQLHCCFQGKSLHQAFRVDGRIKKRGAPTFQSRNHLKRSYVCELAPSLDCYSSVLRIDGEYQTLSANGACYPFGEFTVRLIIANERGSKDYTPRPNRQRLLSRRDRTNSSTNLTRQTPSKCAHQLAVVAGADSGIQIDEL